MRDPVTGLSMGLSHYPPGCTDRDVDRAMDGDRSRLCVTCEAAPAVDGSDRCEEHEAELIAYLTRRLRRERAGREARQEA